MNRLIDGVLFAPLAALAVVAFLFEALAEIERDVRSAANSHNRRQS